MTNISVTYSESKGMALRKRVKIAILYIILGAGGLWHLLGMFQTTMKILAAPLLIGLTIWLAIEYLQRIENSRRLRFVVWSGGIIVVGFLLEWLGVKTGVIFGQYQYGNVLKPQIAGVPISIGFAWLGLVLSSFAVTQTLFRRFTNNGITVILSAALLIVIFDLLMEPAAIRLGYWSWDSGQPGLQNYFVWFLAGVLFLISGKQFRALDNRIPRIGIHIYLAQMLYFILVKI